MSKTIIIGKKQYQFVQHKTDEKVVLRLEGNGIIYLGKSAVGDIAIKEVKLHWNDPDSRHRFTQEVQQLSNLDHMNIIQYHAYSDNGAIGRIIVKHEISDTLKNYMKKNTMHEEKVFYFFKQLLMALQHMHNKGIVHGDISSDNILITKDEQLKLSNFEMSQDLANYGHHIRAGGTSGYTAPELCAAGREEERITPSCDVYSCGVLLYEMSMAGNIDVSKVNLRKDLSQAEMSRNMRQLIAHAVEEDPMSRLSIDHLLNLECMQDASTRVSLLPQSDQSSLRLDNESGTYSRNSQNTEGTIHKAIKKLVSINVDQPNKEARLDQTSTDGSHTNRDSLTTNASTYKLLTAETHSTIATDFAHSTFVNSDISVRHPAVLNSYTKNDLVNVCKLSSNLPNEKDHVFSLHCAILLLEKEYQQEIPNRFIDTLLQCEDIIQAQLIKGLERRSFERTRIRLKRIELHLRLLISIYCVDMLDQVDQSDWQHLSKLTATIVKKIYTIKNQSKMAHVNVLLSTAIKVASSIITETKPKPKNKREDLEERKDIFKTLASFVWNKSCGKICSINDTNYLMESIKSTKTEVDRYAAIYFLSNQVDNYQYVIPKIQLLHKLNADGEIDVIDEAIAMTFTTTHILSRSRNPDDYKLLLEGRKDTLGLPITRKGKLRNNWRLISLLLTKELVYHRYSEVKDVVQNIHRMPSMSHAERMELYKRQICELYSGNNLTTEANTTICTECEAVASSYKHKPLIKKHTCWNGYFDDKIVLLVIDIAGRSNTHDESKTIDRDSIESNATIMDNPIKANTIENQIEVLQVLSENAKEKYHMKLLAYQQKIVPYYFICESGENGKNLSHYLADEEKLFPGKTLPQLCEITLVIIRAVNYCNGQRVLIRNITAGSFVIFSNGQIKLFPNHQAVYIAGPGKLECYGNPGEEMPVLWMSGESLFHPHLYSPLTEVYSVGRTIMQVVLFNRYPMFEMYGMTLEQKLIKLLMYGLRLGKPKCIPLDLYLIVAPTLNSTAISRCSLNTLEDKMVKFLSMQSKQGLMDIYKDSMPKRDEQQPPYPQMVVPNGIRKYHSIEDLKRHNETRQSSHTVQVTPEELIAPDNPKRCDDGFRCDLKYNLEGNVRKELCEMRHQNIMTIDRIESKKKGQRMYFGPSCKESLLDYVLRCKNMSDRQLVGYFIQISEGVKFLHDRNIVIGYLPSKFIYLDKDGVAKIGCLARLGKLVMENSNGSTDFDRVTVNHLFSSGVNISAHCNLMDMIRYVAREFNEHGTCSFRSDVGALAHTFIELLFARVLDDVPESRLAAVPYAAITKEEVLKLQPQRPELVLPKGTAGWLKQLLRFMLADPFFRRSQLTEVISILKHRQPSEHPVIKAGGRGRTTMCAFAEEDWYMFDDERFRPPKLLEPELKQQTASFHLSFRSSGQSEERGDMATNGQYTERNVTELKPMATSTLYHESGYVDANTSSSSNQKQQAVGKNTAPCHMACRESSGHPETLAMEAHDNPQQYLVEHVEMATCKQNDQQENHEYENPIGISSQNRQADEPVYFNMNRNIVHPPLPIPPSVYLHPGGIEESYADTDVSDMTYYNTNTDYLENMNDKKNHKCILM